MMRHSMVDLAARCADLLLTDASFAGLGEIRHLRKTLRHLKIDCVLDVGANVGQYATMLRKRVGYTGLIVSFEPNPEAFSKLQEKAHGDPHWITMNLALSSFDGTARFNVMAEDQFSSMKMPSTDEYADLAKANVVRQSINVRCARLDTIFDDIQQRHPFSSPFLKLDTQGNDLEVFSGAAEIIEKIRGIQSELSFKRLYADSPTFNDSLNVYANAGFQLSALVPNNSGHFPFLLEMDCIMVKV